ncbi:acyltransferase [Micromonospora sp. WMMD1155]|uniref:acyltransferase family protein n=1 Tax=Micromonospora sp. WMMD1155 TaxID=3016094 RepID=UPI00249B930F|nr:acyltransferase [Micromonospora sp. WMMD1155]WFE49807.1 acyltransferase [Micromonospora sp. WMMD1155]
MTKTVLGAARARLASPLGARELDLDVVRGVAILLAVGWHLAGKPTGNPVSDVMLLPTRTFGWAGVDLFFVLSGFLVGRLIFREQVRTGGFDAGRFLLRRAFKLWPVYYLFIAFLMITHPWDPWQFLPQTIHVQNYTQTKPPHLWSLAVEEHFYLAAALLLPIAFRRRVRPQTLVKVIFGIMVATLVGRVIAVQIDTKPVLIQQLTHFRVDAMLAGMLLAVASVYYTELFDRIVAWKWLWLGGTVLGIAWLWTNNKNSDHGASFGYSVAYLSSASFLLLLYRAEWVVRFRAVLRPIGTLGIYSYAIYLTHVSAAEYVNQAVVRVAPWVNETPLRLAVLYAGVFVIAVVLTRAVEWPALKLRDRLIPPRARAVPPVPPEEATRPEEATQPHTALDGPTQQLPFVANR